MAPGSPEEMSSRERFLEPALTGVHPYSAGPGNIFLRYELGYIIRPGGLVEEKEGKTRTGHPPAYQGPSPKQRFRGAVLASAPPGLEDSPRRDHDLLSSPTA